MRIGNFIKLFIGGLVVLAATSFNTTLQWSLQKNEDSIKVFTRETPNTNLKEVKVLFTVKSTPNKIANTVLDVENHDVWMENVDVAKTLKTINQNESYVYYEFDFPWPSSNRDVVNHTRIYRDSNNEITKITTIAAPDFIPEKDGIVRITVSDGTWIFKPLDNGFVEVNHVLLASPGGDVPEWVVNMFVINQPFESHKKLKNFLEK